MPDDTHVKDLNPGALRVQVQELRHALAAAQVALHREQERTAIAKKSAADAWAFARTMLRGNGSKL